MRSRKREVIFMGIGILAGLALSGPAAQAADYLTAKPSTQTFYINGQQAQLTAYIIGGSNYVRLRDIGRAVDFGVTYDAATNSVYIDSTQPYQEESTPTASTLSEENVRAALRTERRPSYFRRLCPCEAVCVHPTSQVASVHLPAIKRGVGHCVRRWGKVWIAPLVPKKKHEKICVCSDNSRRFPWLFPPNHGMVCRYRRRAKCVTPWKIYTSVTSHPANSR